ncbi:serine O-acetyltransferase [Sorangium sp. So ce124]|uniref:serine O-acetyltransferase n=1 Tax=Sorangium sp. So ce124 TaxID=3133280 RepID=UPI003F629A62
MNLKSVKNPPVLLYRIGNFFHQRKMPSVAMSITWLNRFAFAAFVPSSATIGENFRLGYWGLGVVIHPDAVIGDNCIVGQNVTIGKNFGRKRAPRIGNDVYIGAGSVVIGDITVGDNVIIGANSVVNKDVPSNTVVAGNPFRIIASGRMLKYYEL